MRNSNLLLKDYTDNRSLEELMNSIALESSIMLDIVEVFKNIVPKLSERLNGFKLSFSRDNSEEKPLFAEFSNLDKKVLGELNSLSYVELSHTLISVPEGFSGNLLSYNNTLLDISGEIYSHSLQVLADYHAILSNFITNKESQTSIKDYKSFSDRVSRTEGLLNERIYKFHKSGNPSKTYFKNAFGRMSEVKDLSLITTKLFSNHSKVNLENIKESISKTTDLLDIITEQLASYDITKVSKQAASAIADGGYAVGKQIELTSAFYYRCIVALETTVKLFNQLKDI